MKQQAQNTFTDGLNTDFHPLNCKNTILTDALNATIVTTKGNEMVLQNDTGNIKIPYGTDNVKLSEGFIPIGIKEHQGVLYIVSYNPTTKFGEIGTYPSPDYSDLENNIIPVYNSQDNVEKILSMLNTYQPLYNGINTKDMSIIQPKSIKTLTSDFFNFDMNHSLEIEIQKSYDGSINLILNDGHNIPRLINTRFSVLGEGKCKIPKRRRNDDNLYSLGDKEDFNIDTSLIKRTKKFPIVNYGGVLNTGNLKVGNYTFYFKYCDTDGNETDWIAESGVVSIFKGNDSDPFSIDGGVEDMNANKSIQFTLTNIDSSYHYIKVYYVRTSAAKNQGAVQKAYSIVKTFEIKNADNCNILISGDDQTTDIDINEINQQYQSISSVKTQAQCQNILFQANTTELDINYLDLTDLSLRITPKVIKTDSKNIIGYVNQADYTDTITNLDGSKHQFNYEYYNTKNIYYNVGYWNEEYYRFGIVYIYDDNSLSSVYNILGADLQPGATIDQIPSVCDNNNKRVYLETDNNYTTINDNKYNIRGVVHINDSETPNPTLPYYDKTSYIYNIQINIPNDVKKYLQEDLKIKGFFIVRQKRIPTIVCQGFTLPWDKEAKVPVIEYWGINNLRLDENDSKKALKQFNQIYLNREEVSDGIYKDHNMINGACNIIHSSESDGFYKLFYSKKYAVESFCYQVGEELEDTKGIFQSFTSDRSLLRNSLTNQYDEHLCNIMPVCIDDKIISYNEDSVTNNKSVTSSTETTDTEMVITTTTVENVTTKSETGSDGKITYTTAPSGYYYKKTTIQKSRTNKTTGITTYDTPTYSYELLKQVSGDSIYTTNVIGGYAKNWGNLYSSDVYISDRSGLPIQSTTTTNITLKVNYYLNRLVQQANDSDIVGDLCFSAEKAYLAKRLTDLYKYCDGNQLVAISPEFEVNQPYYNQLFTGSKYTIKYTKYQQGILVTNKDRIYYTSMHPDNYNYNYLVNGTSKTYSDCFVYNPVTDAKKEFKICSVTDNVPTIAIDNTIFKSVIGTDAEAFRFSFINEEKGPIRDIDNEDSPGNDFNIIRGIFSPYLGITSNYATNSLNYSEKDNGYCRTFNIYYDNYNDNVFDVRFQNTSPYYTISDRISWNLSNEDLPELSVDNDTKDLKLNLFRGDCFLCTFTHRLNRNFNDPTAPTNDVIIDNQTWLNNYVKSGGDTSKFSNINRGDINAVKLGSWITIKIKSSHNLSIRSLDESFTTEIGVMGRARGFYPLQQASADGGYKLADSYVFNDGFSSTVGFKTYNTLPDMAYVKNEFENRIIYSDENVIDAQKNGYRVFKSGQHRDYNKQYGKIVKLLELQNNLLCVYEHGVSLIPISERALAAQGSGGEIYITSANVLPDNIQILNDMYGSQWADSIIKTPYWVCGIDSKAKKIWATNGTSFKIISDFKVEKFLTEYLNIGENDTELILGKKNIVSHYNAGKSEVMFTFYNPTQDGGDETVFNLCLNLILGGKNGQFTTFYSWIPIASANINNTFYSFNREIFRDVKSETISYLYKHGTIDNKNPYPCYWYDRQHPFEFEFIVNQNPNLQKTFENLQIISNKAQPESFHFTIVGENYQFNEDKPNIYVRQEATKNLWHNLKSEITYNNNYEKLIDRGLSKSFKSTIFPLYYEKFNYAYKIDDDYNKLTNTTEYYNTNNIYDCFVKHSNNNRDYSMFSGSEIQWDEQLNEFNIITHIPCSPINGNWKLVDEDTYNKYLNNGDKVKTDTSRNLYYVWNRSGFMRGNAEYKEDLWHIQIPSINLVQKNEQPWVVPPIILSNTTSTVNDNQINNIVMKNLPSKYQTESILQDTKNLQYLQHINGNYNDFIGQINTDEWTYRKEVKIKDKYIKIRVRYSGIDPVIITAVTTTFSPNYA